MVSFLWGYNENKVRKNVIKWILILFSFTIKKEKTKKIKSFSRTHEGTEHKSAKL